MDSRTDCGGAERPALPDGAVLGPGHLADDTVNVVIVEAGLVGLYLANALTEVNVVLRTYGTDGTSPEIRTVVFEKRVTADGRKKPYSRTFVTGVSPREHMIGAIDGRVTDESSALFGEDGSTFFPVNFWETLLLLSNRDRGIKLIYGDVDDYAHLLARVPNLLVVDAAGHRLRPLDRGGDDARTTVSAWTEGASFAPADAARRW